MEICRKCEFNSKNIPNYKNLTRPDEHCIRCMCTLAAKTKCMSCECPLPGEEKKWEALVSAKEESDINEEINTQENGKDKN
jgi:hypothetical protein